jgi:hypothetical protein
MIDQQTVWQEIWPVVEELIQATLAENDGQVRQRLAPGEQAAGLHDLFGYPVFDILLKTVLGRGRLGLTRAIETEQGKFVHIEYAWPDSESEDNSYTAADVSTVKLKRYGKQWRVVEVNPASVDVPLTEARAQGILISSKALSTAGGVPQEPWILPVALFGGALQMPIRPGAMGDEVERLLLPGLQHRTYGVLSLLAGRRVWRDFKKKEITQGRKGAKKGTLGNSGELALARPRAGTQEKEQENPKSQIPNPKSAAAAWAAAVEYILSEQSLREVTQAAVAQHYQVNLTDIVSRIRQIKETLNIRGLDERYTPFQPERIVLKQAGHHVEGNSGEL